MLIAITCYVVNAKFIQIGFLATTTTRVAKIECRVMIKNIVLYLVVAVSVILSLILK